MPLKEITLLAVTLHQECECRKIISSHAQELEMSQMQIVLTVP